MLHAIDPRSTVPQLSAQRRNSFQHLELEFDPDLGVLWKYLKQNSTPYFSSEQLTEIRYVQEAIAGGLSLDVDGYASDKLRYVVLASRNQGIFSLGGDLRLFRDLIEKRDRPSLQFYAQKAADAVYHHATNTKNITTFSLVQGTAMGGGFEAAIAGNVVVAERGNRMGFPEVLFGLFPGMGAYTLLRRKVDAVTAEKIILDAENFAVEDLHTMGVVDVLVDPGEGEHAIYSYVSRQRNRPGAAVFRNALNKVRVIDRDELYTIADEWVSAAMELSSMHLRRIDKLIASQQKLSRTVVTNLR